MGSKMNFCHETRFYLVVVDLPVCLEDMLVLCGILYKSTIICNLALRVSPLRNCRECRCTRNIGVCHMKTLSDKLYTIYSASPQNKTEPQVRIRLKSTGSCRLGVT